MVQDKTIVLRSLAERQGTSSSSEVEKRSIELEGHGDSNIQLGFGSTEEKYFFPALDYSSEEERAVIRTLDWKLMPWVLLVSFVLNMDRTNHSNAISDNLPQDLGFNINTVNTGTIIYSLCFTVASFTGALAAKRTGPSRWIPTIMVAWGIVTLCHAAIKNRSGYLAVRAFIAITEGGVNPAIMVYLSGFYKSRELATRLAWVWGTQSVANAITGLMAAGILHLAGVRGLEGWKWLFIIDGIITIFIAVLTWFYLPRNVATTRGGFRGPRPWFSDRNLAIAVTRVIRDDYSKRAYETSVTWADVRDAATDLGLWGHLMITAIGLTPTAPISTYLPTVIKLFNFNVYVANALVAPPYILQFCAMVLMTWNSDRTGERGYHGTVGSIWQLVGFIVLRSLPHSASKGAHYVGTLITAGWPMTHALNIGWMNENMGTLGKKTVAMGAIIAIANLSLSWGSQIYQASDSPDFKTGNIINIVFSAVVVVQWLQLKYYYKRQNKLRAARWNTLSDEQKRQEEHDADRLGNRSVTFCFTD
ncbi:MFS general substrate transporter [Ramaria rubella]|nr:MFS general substrate transporter [Ramaria rubella]